MGQEDCESVDSANDLPMPPSLFIRLCGRQLDGYQKALSTDIAIPSRRLLLELIIDYEMPFMLFEHSSSSAVRRIAIFATLDTLIRAAPTSSNFIQRSGKKLFYNT